MNDNKYNNKEDIEIISDIEIFNNDGTKIDFNEYEEFSYTKTSSTKFNSFIKLFLTTLVLIFAIPFTLCLFLLILSFSLIIIAIQSIVLAVKSSLSKINKNKH